jgi:hypothetical protein
MQEAGEPTLTRHNMMVPLVEAVPSFAPVWESCIEGWTGEGEQDMPIYLGLSMLADHLIVALERGDAACLRAAFPVIERWFLQGDTYVTNAAAVGLFEDLDEADRYTSASVEEMQAWLTPGSQVWWHSING